MSDRGAPGTPKATCTLSTPHLLLGDSCSPGFGSNDFFPRRGYVSHTKAQSPPNQHYPSFLSLPPFLPNCARIPWQEDPAAAGMGGGERSHSRPTRGMFPADAEAVSEWEPGPGAAGLEEGKPPTPAPISRAGHWRLAGVGTMLMPHICTCTGQW